MRVGVVGVVCARFASIGCAIGVTAVAVATTAVAAAALAAAFAPVFAPGFAWAFARVFGVAARFFVAGVVGIARFVGFARFVAFDGCVGFRCAFVIALVAVATAPTATAFAPVAAFAVVSGFARFARGLAFGLFLFLDFVLFLDQIVFDGLDDRFEARDEFGARPARCDAHLGAFVFAFGDHFDHDAIARLDLGKIGALGIEHVDRGFLAGIERDDAALALGGFVFDHAQRRKPGGRCRPHQPRPVTMRAGAGGRFEYPGAQPLTAHFHQAKARNPPDLNARAVVLERVLHRLFDFADVRSVFHVDEVDDNQAGHVAQAQLTGDFARRFEIGRQRGRLDPEFLGRPARVDVDRHQRFGRVDHEIAAAAQLDHGIVHRGQLIFGAIALEQRDRVGILLYPLGVTRHQQLHEILGGAIARFAFDHDLFDFAIIDVADGALDQIAVRMDQRGRACNQRVFADFVPQPGEVVEVALDLGLGALQPGGAHDAAHRLGQRHFRDDRLEPLAIGRRIDLAADPAAMAGIGHQHAIAAGEAEISGQRGALVAAFFLDHLDQQHLAALDHVLDLVAAAQRQTACAQFVGFLGLTPALAPTTAPAALPPVAFAAFAFGVFVFGVVAVFDHAAFDRRNLARAGVVDLGYAVGIVERIAALKAAIFEFVIFILVGGAQRGLGLGMTRLFGEQGFAVFLGDLVIVGVDLAERKKTMTISAKVHECGLKRGLNPGYLGKVDIALYLFVIGRLEIELFNPVAC